MTRPTWREQYDRMKRWHSRLAESNKVNERRVDDFYAFFTCCFHLKDWLKGDLGGAIGQEAEDLIGGRLPLLMCADVVNGFKHLVLDPPDPRRRRRRGARVDKAARVETTMRAFRSLWPADQPVPDLSQGASVVVLAFGQAYEAMTIAEDCLKLWDEFLREKGLL